ncbi:MAG: hypothetical protein P1V35_02625 [Planctomycetota bacterium]|nr:hypothetical protein [Planctomycetota bacterium]
MNYHEATNISVTASQAKVEIEKHDCDFYEFVTEYGIHPIYSGADVLDWLGYETKPLNALHFTPHTIPHGLRGFI